MPTPLESSHKLKESKAPECTFQIIVRLLSCSLSAIISFSVTAQEQEYRTNILTDLGLQRAEARDH